MSLYLDTSVVVPLFVEEPGSRVARGWLQDQEQVAYVSDLVVAEFHSVVSRFVRMDLIDNERASTLRNLFASWSKEAAEPLENTPADIRAASRLVQTPVPKLLTADATHLATCRRLGLTLVSLDKPLQSICEREGVSWATPGKLT